MIVIYIKCIYFCTTEINGKKKTFEKIFPTFFLWGNLLLCGGAGPGLTWLAAGLAPWPLEASSRIPLSWVVHVGGRSFPEMGEENIKRKKENFYVVDMELIRFLRLILHNIRFAIPQWKIKLYLESSPQTSSLDTRPCRHWKAHSGESTSCLRVASGLSLKKTGIGPAKLK